MEKHLYETGLIGNCAYLGHIHKNTNVAWLCWPRFDSEFVFGGLLDDKAGGEFSITPEDRYTSRQYYLENTNVLCTEITTSSGRYRVTDFAPRFHQFGRNFKPTMLVRKIEPLDGTPRIRVTCRPVTDYGRSTYEWYRGSNHIEYRNGKDKLRLTTDIAISYLTDEQFFALNDTRYLILTHGEPLEAPLVSTAETFLRETIEYWRLWVKHCSIAQFNQPY